MLVKQLELFRFREWAEKSRILWAILFTVAMTHGSSGQIAVNDQSAALPAGMPQLPNLLSDYIVRPPWLVAGVDYHVGAPSTTMLKDPSTASADGVSIKGHEIDVTGSDVISTGYNFTGWNVYITGNNDTIENSVFEATASNNGVSVYATGFVTLLNNTFNGGGVGGPRSAVAATGGGLIEYNHFADYPNDFINPGGPDITIKYNLFNNLGFGTGNHSDVIQFLYRVFQFRRRI